MLLNKILTGKNSTFAGTIKQTAHVMTSVSEVAFFGVLFTDGGEWLRVATDDIPLAERVAFLQSGSSVRITVEGSIVQARSSYHRLVRIDII